MLCTCVSDRSTGSALSVLYISSGSDAVSAATDLATVRVNDVIVNLQQLRSLVRDRCELEVYAVCMLAREGQRGATLLWREPACLFFGCFVVFI